MSKIEPFKEGYVIRSSCGTFRVEYAGYTTVGNVIKITNCQKCEILKMSKNKSCKPLLNKLFDIPINVGCLLKRGYVFKKVKGGI